MAALSNFHQAAHRLTEPERLAQLETLKCVHCDAQNRPGTTPVVELAHSGVAWCSVCAKTFTPSREGR